MTDTTTDTTTDPATNSGEQTQAQTSDTGDKGGAGGKPAGKAAAKGADDAGGSGGEPAFYEAFSDDLKNSPVVLRHKTPEDLARSLVAAEKKIGVPADQLIRKPTKPEEYADVYKALGAPETPEGYKIELPENATDADKDYAARFAQHMHEKGPFPPDMVKAVIEFVNADTLKTDADLVKAQETARAEAETFLKTELGAAYDPEMKAVGTLLNKYGSKELQAELDRTGLGDKQHLMLALQKIAQDIAEPGDKDLPGGRPSSQSAAMTPGQAKAARITLENDPIKGPALRDGSHAMHKAVVEERNRLFDYEAGRDPDKKAA